MDEELKKIVQNMIDAGESEANIAKVIQVYKPVKKKVGSANQGMASQPSAGTSGSTKFRLAGDQDVAELEKRGQMPSAKGRTPKTDTNNLYDIPDGNRDVSNIGEELKAANYQKSLHDPQKKQFAKEFLAASTVNDDKRNELAAAIEAEYNNEGAWNSIKAFGRGIKNFFTTGIPSTQALTDETKQAKAEFDALNAQERKAKKPVTSYTPDDIVQRAKAIALEKRLQGEKETQVADFLSVAEDVKMPGRFTHTTKKDVIQGMTEGELASLSLKDKNNSKKLDVIYDGLDNSVKELTELTQTINRLQDSGQEIPQETAEQFRDAYSLYEQLLSEGQKTQIELMENREQIGTAEDNLDLLKRTYSKGKNFLGQLNASGGDIVSGLLGFYAYGNMNQPGSIDALIKANEIKTKGEKTRDRLRRAKSVEDLTSLNDFGRWMADLTAQQLPVLAATMTGAGGIGVLGASATGNKYAEMTEEQLSGDADYNAAQFASIPLLFGATEAASAAVDLNLLKGAGRVLSSATEPEKRLIAKGMTERLFESAKTLGKPIAIEGGEEGLTQLTQNLIDINFGGKEIDVWDGVNDAVAAGAAMGGAIGSPGFVAQTARTVFDRFTRDTKLRTASEEVLKLEALLNNPDLSDTAHKEAERQLAQAETKLSGLVADVAKKVSGMDNADFKAIIAVEKEKAKIRKSAREIDSDSTIDEDTKKMLLGNLKSDLDAADQRRIAILNKPESNNNQISKSNENNDFQKSIPEIPNSNQINNEAAQGDDTVTDGDVQPGTGKLGDSESQPQAEETGVTNQENIPATTDPGTGEVEVKRLKVPAVKNGEFDVTLDANGNISKITSVKDGREVPKFVERTNKQTGRKSLVRNGNYSQIEAEVNGTITTNKANEERKQKIAEAISNFTPADAYGAALQYIATGGSVSLESARRETGLGDSELRWATGFKKDAELPSVERASEIITEGTDLDQQEVRNALIELLQTKSGVSQVQEEIVSLQELSNLENERAELEAFKNTLSEKDRSMLDALRAEEGYLSDISEQEAAEYYEQQINDYEQGKRATEALDAGGADTIESDEAEAGRKGEKPGEQDGGITDLSQSRKKEMVTERIKPLRRAPKNPPKKLNQIIADAATGLKSTLIYGRSSRGGSLGTYNPTTTLIRLRKAGDIDTAAHEIGHLLDDRHAILNTIPSDKELDIERELKWFSDRGGSNPPGSLSAAKKAEYLQREGLAEFIAAYISNPQQAKLIAPELYSHFENSLDERTKEVLQQFSDDFIDFANATAGEQMESNIEDLFAKDKKGFKEWLDRFKGEEGNLTITPWDNINAHVFNSMGIAEKAFSFLTNITGETNLLPEKNFEMISRLFAGVNGKTNRVLSSGMIDAKNNVLKDSDGNPMNVEWLVAPLDSTSEETVKQDMNEVIKFLVAERTLEYARKFLRLDDLTGIGGGINSDVDVAQSFLNDFEQLKIDNKEKYDRIKEAAKRYRQLADAGLKYAVDKGRISKERYEQIKEDNQYYVSLTRVKENAPGEEAVPFFNENGGGIASVKDVFHKAKGGTDLIQNPYVSLLQNTVNFIKESDRNEVLASFIEPIRKVREMGDGTPTNFAQVAAPAVTGDKNVKPIFVKGEEQRWNFVSKAVYDALTGLEGASSSPYVELLSKPASLIRFTVTNFPTFALRNAVRDTTSRMIVSRTNSGFKDLVQSANDKELFELYGGSQAGFYLANKDGYRDKMQEAVKEITKKGGIVMNPRTFYRKYRKVLERGENLNRIAEFKSAYRKAKKQGLDDYNAGLYAAYQARDLMDFAVAGHTVRQLNRIIPFFNAGIQGLRRSGKAVKEDPTGFAVRTALYTVLPSILFRQLITAMGDDEEYEELPAYQRDMFWNFKTPFTGNVWISIPKPFEQGMISSTIDRAYSQAAGSETAWDGFGGSVAKSLTPFDESSLLGGAKPFYEVAANYNYFRDTNIVPAWEEGKLMELRKGTAKASRVGKGVTWGLKQAGMEVDPRKVDHLLTGYGTYMADWGLSLGDLGVEDSRFRFGPSKTGFAKDVPINNAVSVNAVYKLATELNKWNSPDIKRLRGKIDKYYAEEDPAKQKELSQLIYEDARLIRRKFEAQKEKIKGTE